jgi:hypothetical protein
MPARQGDDHEKGATEPPTGPVSLADAHEAPPIALQLEMKEFVESALTAFIIPRNELPSIREKGPEPPGPPNIPPPPDWGDNPPAQSSMNRRCDDCGSYTMVPLMLTSHGGAVHACRPCCPCSCDNPECRAHDFSCHCTYLRYENDPDLGIDQYHDALDIDADVFRDNLAFQQDESYEDQDNDLSEVDNYDLYEDDYPSS